MLKLFYLYFPHCALTHAQPIPGNEGNSLGYMKILKLNMNMYGKNKNIKLR